MAVVAVSGSVDLSIDVNKRIGFNIGALTRDAQKEIRDIIRDLASEWRVRMIRTWPVDTRTSQRNWESRETAGIWIIRNDVEYVEFVNDGADWQSLEEFSERILKREIPRMRKIARAGKPKRKARKRKTRQEQRRTLRLGAVLSAARQAVFGREGARRRAKERIEARR